MSFLISFQEVGSPVGRIVKSEELLKAAGPALVRDVHILSSTLLFCAMIIKSSFVSVSSLGNKNICRTC
jgi:hypothetical protein